ncbi:MAG: hypothetical protein WCH34_15780 [Bacteroidota bacterium]
MKKLIFSLIALCYIALAGATTAFKNEAITLETILITTIIQPNITIIEYFIDTDPGIGNGFQLTTSIADSLDMYFNVPLTSVSAGFHTIYVRVKDDQNKWSHTHNMPFYKMPTYITTTASVNQLEYFIDTDPGFGNGSQVSTTLTDSTLTDFIVPLQNVNQGFHTIYVRAKDNHNKWSMTHVMPFYKISPPIINMVHINQLEYFFDTDPGFGNAIAVATADSADITSDIIANLSGLSNGLHKLYVRAKDNQNHWSLTQYDTLTIKIPPSAASQINGQASVCQTSDSILYMVSPILNATSYIWTLPTGIIGVSNTNNIWLHFSPTFISGTISVKGHNVYGDGATSSMTINNNPPNAPIGNAIQSFNTQASIADLVVTGSSIKWYDAPSAGNLLQSSDLLINGNTYYASQTLSGCESQNRLGVTVSLNIIKNINLHLFLEGLFDYNTGNSMLEAKDIDWASGISFPKYGSGIADRIHVELYEGTPPFTSPIVNISGIDLSTSGLATFQISPSWTGNYYIRLITRNHLEVWSAIAVPFNTNPVVYDFTSNSLSAYQAPGGNDPQAQVVTGVYAFYLGDLDHSLSVDFDDFNLFEPYLTDGTYGFTIADFNGNGLCDFDDFNLFEPRLNMGPFTQYPGMMK